MVSQFWGMFVPGAAGLFVFLNSLHGELVFDDVHAVERNKDVLGTNSLSQLFLNDFWGEPMASNSSHKSYRPITVLTLRANHMMHGLDPCGYHIVNLVLHSLVSALAVPFYVRLLHGDRIVAETAALLFALHPVHCEAVASVVGRAELLGASFLHLTFLKNGVSSGHAWLLTCHESGQRLKCACYFPFSLLHGPTQALYSQCSLSWLCLSCLKARR